MKTISVRVNGSLADALGTSRTSLQLPSTATVADLVAVLADRHPAASALLARAVVVTGGKHIDHSMMLDDRQEVAILMPIAGG